MQRQYASFKEVEFDLFKIAREIQSALNQKTDPTDGKTDGEGNVTPCDAIYCFVSLPLNNR